MTFKHWWRCGRKKRYVNRGEANRGLKSFRKIIRKFVRVYYCEDCDGWHLTTKPKK